MLIRIVDHFHNNPKRIDKLIAVKGMPEDWFFRQTPEGPELKRPWEADIDKNIPIDIRHMCEPMYVIFRYPAMQSGGAPTIEKRQILGVRIDYNSEPGRQMWEDVERFIEESTPRNERIPVAVLCAKDERSSFETYAARRNTRGSLELVPAPIPLVDLTRYEVVRVQQNLPDRIAEESAPVPPAAPAPAVVPPPPPPPPPPPEELPMVAKADIKCEDCEYTHRSKQGIRMHKMKKHRITEKVGVS